MQMAPKEVNVCFVLFRKGPYQWEHMPRVIGHSPIDHGPGEKGQTCTTGITTNKMETTTIIAFPTIANRKPMVLIQIASRIMDRSILQSKMIWPIFNKISRTII